MRSQYFRTSRECLGLWLYQHCRPRLPTGGQLLVDLFGGQHSGRGANTYLFSDGVHPSTGAHRVIADVVKSLIEGPNAYSVMAEVPLSTRAAHIRTLDEGIARGRNAAVGKITPFAAVENSKYDIGTNALSPATDTKNRAATVGVSMRCRRCDRRFWCRHQQGRSAHARRWIRCQRIHLLSVFASGKWNGFYGSLTGSFANLKFENVRRSIQLWPGYACGHQRHQGCQQLIQFHGRL